MVIVVDILDVKVGSLLNCLTITFYETMAIVDEIKRIAVHRWEKTLKQDLHSSNLFRAFTVLKLKTCLTGDTKVNILHQTSS